MIKVVLQIATDNQPLPTKEDITLWVNQALKEHVDQGELCIRVIDEEESQKLNNQYRHKNYPTNVLTFDYQDEQNSTDTLLGDIAICAAVVNQEAKKFNLSADEHWAHIIIHGCLHLAGFDHDNDQDTKTMEAKESLILKQLGFKDPYQ